MKNKNKYGFVYIWYDKTRKMYYIGSHWGTIEDNYICSSKRMKNAYNKRPNDFKRKILKSNISDKNKLIEEEYYWLSFISENELTVKYYNIRKYMFGKGHKHKWNHTEETKQKISEASNKRDNSLYKNKLSVVDKRTGKTYRIPCSEYDKKIHKSLMFNTTKKVTVIDLDGNKLGVTKEEYKANKHLYKVCSSIHNKGRISINDGINRKRINSEDLENYIKEGWELGWPKKQNNK